MMLLLQCCALSKFHMIIDQKMHMIRLWIIEGLNAYDQFALRAFHSFLVQVQTNAGYQYICATLHPAHTA